MFTAVTDYGISSRAISNGLLTLQCWNPRSFTHDKHQTVDSRPYGGGPGMVMMIEPLRAALQAARSQLPNAKVVYLSPQGRTLDQDAVKSFATRDELILLCGRYEGIDERLLQLEVDEEWSVGDYVLSGGELPAMVLVDAVIRLLPGALGHEQSAEQDSFNEGLLDCPHYTRPDLYEGMAVPPVLLSGHHAEIKRWRLQQSLQRTRERRPDLYARQQSGDET
jgi:tRNA (guanine37-N1)-methyltransferase